MLRIPFARAFAVATALVFVATSCSTDDTMGPDMSQQTVSPLLGSTLDGTLSTTVNGVLNTVSGAVQLLTCRPQPYALASQMIGPEGGRIAVGSHVLVIPPQALTQRVKITAEQVRGSVNSVRFGPEGLKFKRSATLTMSYDNCLNLPLPKRIVYTGEQLNILELLRSLDHGRTQDVEAPIDHFSRYAVAW